MDRAKRPLGAAPLRYPNCSRAASSRPPLELPWPVSLGGARAKCLADEQRHPSAQQVRGHEAGAGTSAGDGGVLLLAASAVAVASRFNVAIYLAGAVAVLAVVILSGRRPYLPLLIFAAFIPFDEAVRLGDLGTLGRAGAILFAVVYALPRLGRLNLRATPAAGWVYIGWAVVSLAWALDQGVTTSELGTLIQLFALGVLVADVVVHQPTIVGPVLWAYSLSAAAAGMVGIVGFLGGQMQGGERIAALPGQDPAQYAAVLLPALVFGMRELLRGSPARGQRGDRPGNQPGDCPVGDARGLAERRVRGRGVHRAPPSPPAPRRPGAHRCRRRCCGVAVPDPREHRRRTRRDRHPDRGRRPNATSGSSASRP